MHYIKEHSFVKSKVRHSLCTIFFSSSSTPPVQHLGALASTTGTATTTPQSLPLERFKLTGIVNAIPREWMQIIRQSQEPMSRSMQLHCIPVTAFSETDLFLDRISSELDSHGSTMTNRKTLIDVTASLGRNCLSFLKEKVH